MSLGVLWSSLNPLDDGSALVRSFLPSAGFSPAVQLSMIDRSRIEFREVWKAFQRQTVHLLLRAHIGKWLTGHRELGIFRALKRLSFRVDSGESGAIVGANGTGKSTLLSLTAGQSRADSGSIAVNGLASALLEPGSGFHPDLTGAATSDSMPRRRALTANA